MPLEINLETIKPLVSVVIPTFNRAFLVGRAVRSVLAQTLQAIEVIVVMDGPDAATSLTLREIDDPRLKIETLPAHVGLARCLNAGVRLAQAVWIALLDDDDEWLPQKLELQLQAAQYSTSRYPILSCRLVALREDGGWVMPQRFPNPAESLSEYLFCRKSFLGANGLAQTSTLFTKKELFEKVAPKLESTIHLDFDWVLRATSHYNARLEFLPQTLVVWHIDEHRPRMSNGTDWPRSLAWIQENTDITTPRARAAFILTNVSACAKRGKNWGPFWLLIRESFRSGKPRVMDILIHLTIWLTPPAWRRKTWAALAKKRRQRLVLT
jgi:glycosyltransferase involved in cell wall biosynthesis